MDQHVVSLINRIIDAEHKADEIALAAREKQRSLSGELAGRREEIQRNYLVRASKRITQNRELEEKFADEAILEQNEQSALDMASLEARFTEHREEWAGKLFCAITGSDEYA